MAFASLYASFVDPNVAFLLYIIATLGIYLEISHPGARLPGIVGVIALLLFFMSASALSPNWAGLALMLLSFVFLVLDIKLHAYGLLTLIAVTLLVFGTFLFFNNGHPYAGAQISSLLVYSVAAMIGLIGIILVATVARSHRYHILNGVEGMPGANVIALTRLHPQGSVKYAGEIWKAVLDAPELTADAGSQLKIVSVEGLRLHVQPVQVQTIPIAVPILNSSKYKGEAFS